MLPDYQTMGKSDETPPQTGPSQEPNPLSERGILLLQMSPGCQELYWELFHHEEKGTEGWRRMVCRTAQERSCYYLAELLGVQCPNRGDDD